MHYNTALSSAPGLVGSVGPAQLLHGLVCTPRQLHGDVQSPVLVGHIKVRV